nr:MAG TPA: hypothetical protein [Caudoviricetes sp.]
MEKPLSLISANNLFGFIFSPPSVSFPLGHLQYNAISDICQHFRKLFFLFRKKYCFLETKIVLYM